MKKIIVLTMAFLLLSVSAVSAFTFPEPDWGALFYEKQDMVTATDFDLYAEASPEAAPYYDARLEPRAGTYIGMTADSAEPFKPLGSYLTYIESFSQQDLYYPSNQMIKQDNVITMVGWTVQSMDYIDYDGIRNMLEKLQSYNKPMFVRFANEMNVSELGDDPEKYVQVFRTVADMIHEYSNLAVVWSPCDIGALDRPFEYFYPGDEYVDWVGVSCYMPMYFSFQKNTAEKDTIYFMTGSYAWATNKIKPIMDFMQKNNIQKPVMISEGGVGRYNSYGDDYTGWHEPRLRNMLWYLVMKYPQIKMINYFNVDFKNNGEHYYISDYPESVNIFKEAASSGAYLTSADDTPDFVFSPANSAGTLVADANGKVNLYTLAYIPNQPELTVNYKIDGVWFAASSQIPYTCAFDVGSITDGEHTLTISSYGNSKDYQLFKKGNVIRFGAEPDISYAAQQSEKITVLIDNQEVSFDQPPIIEDGRTLVPLRIIFEKLGATVDWDPETRTAIAVRGDITVTLQIDSNEMLVNGQTKILDVPAKLINDRTLAPARAVSEAFGGTVGWDAESRTVIITTP